MIARVLSMMFAAGFALVVLTSAASAQGEDEGGDLESLTYPWSTRTGIASVDAVLAAIETDTAPPYEYTRVGCVLEQQGIGAPPLCPEGVEEGTLLDTIPSASCEGYYATPSADNPIQLFGGDTDVDYGLLGVHTEDGETIWDAPAGNPRLYYAIVYAWTPDGERYFSGLLGVGLRGLVFRWDGCGMTVEDGERNLPEGTAWILAPQNAPPDAPRVGTGLAPDSDRTPGGVLAGVLLLVAGFATITLAARRRA